MSADEDTLEKAKETLDTMLGYLGFVVDIEIDAEQHGLQIHTKEAEKLIGRHGERLEDIQYLLNRIVNRHDPDAKRIRVDCDHYREMQEDAMIEQIQKLADQVRKTGRPVKLDPLNAYQRRLVHNAFKDDPIVMTWSPPDSGRLKRITLLRRPPKRQH